MLYNVFDAGPTLPQYWFAFAVIIQNNIYRSICFYANVSIVQALLNQ